MNDLRQAAEQALEALQDTCDHLPAKSGVEREVDEAITALQVALAQPEQYDQTALELCEKCGWKAIMPDEGCLVCAREEDKHWGKLAEEHLQALKKDMRAKAEKEKNT